MAWTLKSIIKPTIFLLLLAPAAWIARQTLAGNSGPNPVEYLEHGTGDWALRILLLTLAVTPFRMLTNWQKILQYRRMLGLFAFFYGVVHFSIYLLLDQGLNWRLILADLYKRPYITVGFTALVLMLPLALTSTKGMVRRLGGRRWQSLHRLIYFSAAAAVIHYWWLVKSDIRLPLLYAAILVTLMAFRWRLLPIALLLSCLSTAQTPPPDGLVSPEVHPDRTVTFRVRAPQAAAVTLYGDWMPVGKPEPMTKGNDGVWSVETAPLETNGHLYWFNLDGVSIADPVNPVIKLRQRTSASLVEVPAAEPAPWELRDVAHGEVVTVWHKSAVLGRTERTAIYLPPGYRKGSTRYPVLYLVHGSGDVPESWVNAGRANFILDNLIAEGKAKPMIVVMPAGHALPFTAPRGGPVTNNDLFERYLMKEVIPTVEATYRTSPGARNRALAGLSMGGGHAIYTGFRHSDMFSALGIFSPGLPRDSDPTAFHPKEKLIWISCGDHDSTVQYPKVKAWAESLEQHGIPNTFHTYDGGHTWPVWRMSLADFAPLIFQTKG